MGKTAADLISANARVLTNGDVVGTVNYVSGYEQFSGDTAMQSGHFFPITFGEKYDGQTLKSKGLVYGEKEYTLDEDRTLIVRVENVEGDKLEIVQGEEPVITLNFATATIAPPVGKEAVTIPPDKSFGKFGDNGTFLDGVSVEWDGIAGKVTGTVNKYTFDDDTVSQGEDKTGHFMGFVITNHDGEDITLITGKAKTAKDTDWVVRIDAAKAGTGKITFKAGGTTIGVLDITGVILGA